MQLTSDYPFWSIRNGLPASFPSLKCDLTCEAVVVGGGITGALTAFHLADAGVKTVLGQNATLAQAAPAQARVCCMTRWTFLCAR